jgi:hypothetical protein
MPAATLLVKNTPLRVLHDTFTWRLLGEPHGSVPKWIRVPRISW